MHELGRFAVPFAVFTLKFPPVMVRPPSRMTFPPGIGTVVPLRIESPLLPQSMSQLPAAAVIVPDGLQLYEELHRWKPLGRTPVVLPMAVVRSPMYDVVEPEFGHEGTVSVW